jgi:RHS repeat-associated protein
MTMPGRKYSVGGSGYRYGFNGQENSDEIAAGLTTAMYWEYDSRVGRRWNRDPVVKDWESPYVTFSNNPINRIDILGNSDTTFRSGSGTNITLPSGASDFTTFDGTATPFQGTSGSVTPPAGTLQSFKINGKWFNAAFGGTTGTFLGYYTSDQSLSYNDYAAQQAADGDGSMQAGLYVAINLGKAIEVGTKLGTLAGRIPTGAALPAIPLAGFNIGWNYGSTHADKVTGWVTAIAAATVGRWMGEKVIDDAITFTAPPPGTSTKVYEIGGWNLLLMKWQTLKYGVASSASDTYGGAGNRRPDGQLGGQQGEALRSKYPHLVIGQTTIAVVNSKALAHIWENNLVVLYMIRNKGARPPEQDLPLGIKPR